MYLTLAYNYNASNASVEKSDWLLDSCFMFISANKDECFKSVYMQRMTLNQWFVDGFSLLAGIVGLVNNFVSIMFICQTKYGRWGTFLIALPLRCYYVCNLIMMVLILTSVVQKMTSGPLVYYKYFIVFIGSMTYALLLTANGLLLLMAMLRCLIARKPQLFAPINRSPSGFYKRVYAYIVVIFTLGAAFYITAMLGNLIKFRRVHGVVYLAVIITTVGFNVTSLCTERQRCSEEIELNSTFYKRLYKYIVLSTLIFVITTLPFAVFQVLPYNHNFTELDCHFCQDILMAEDWIYILLFCNSLMDNFLYLALSKEYRDDLRNVCNESCRDRPRISEVDYDPSRRVTLQKTMSHVASIFGLELLSNGDSTSSRP